jgi:two-component system chemotaxis response regulator CheB
MAYDLVVVGTSLGGLAAVSALLDTLPASLRVPIVIAQHRSAGPDFAASDGGLQALWQQHTTMRVVEPEDKGTIARETVYVAPADYHLLVEAPGQFALSTDAPVLWARPSIDVLFETAAEAYGERVIGVILTGASADGSLGLRAIRQHGGCALVQDPASAECAVMPRAAIAATSVNHVLALPELGRVIGALAGGRAS